MKDADESDVDCGGSCAPCGGGKKCAKGTDCASTFCTNGLCDAPSCTDGVKDGDESDLDCGGGNCPGCAIGKMCKNAIDCASITCTNGLCATSQCMDGKQNGAETDVDCGGGTCPACTDGKMCLMGTDCAGGTCTNNVCKANADAGVSDMSAPADLTVTNPKVLLVGAEGDMVRAMALQSALQGTGAFSAIDLFDAGKATPTLQQLQMYSAVLTYVDLCGFADAKTLGDNLATYFDGGGRVVLASFIGVPTNNCNLDGAFWTNGYSLIASGMIGTNPVSLGTINEPQSPLMSGVKTLSLTYHDDTVQTANGAVVVAQWDDGTPAVLRGTVKGRKRVDLNFDPIPANNNLMNGWTGDGATLIRNALLFQ